MASRQRSRPQKKQRAPNPLADVGQYLLLNKHFNFNIFICLYLNRIIRYFTVKGAHIQVK